MEMSPVLHGNEQELGQLQDARKQALPGVLKVNTQAERKGDRQGNKGTPRAERGSHQASRSTAGSLSPAQGMAVPAGTGRGVWESREALRCQLLWVLLRAAARAAAEARPWAQPSLRGHGLLPGCSAALPQKRFLPCISRAECLLFAPPLLSCLSRLAFGSSSFTRVSRRTDIARDALCRGRPGGNPHHVSLADRDRAACLWSAGRSRAAPGAQRCSPCLRLRSGSLAAEHPSFSCC